jgi:predicted peptidase
MIRRALASTTVALLTLSAISVRSGVADDQRGFLNRVFKDSEGKEYKYVVFVPHDYKGDDAADKRWPLILFLHGAGERGDDGELQAKVGLAPAIRKREKDFPFIAVFPQCDKNSWWRADAPDGERAMAILAEIEKEYKTDRDRVYLTGLSMGGMGTWSLSMKYPDRFAALVPICGRGDNAQAEKIAKLPIWCFHGDADKAVAVDGSRSMIAAIKEAGGNPKYTEYPGVGHNSWDAAYGTDELYTWLLQQKRNTKAKE